MDEARERVLRWAQEGEALTLPAWEELPSIPLYMDQVILYLQDSLRLFQGEEDRLLTSSMINNYVKNQVLPHPEKKKYGREHLGALMAVCMLKQVLPIGDVKALLDEEPLGPEAYDLFRQAHTAAVRETCRSLSEHCQSGESLKKEALRLAAEANAKRAAAQRILQELQKEDEPPK